jgi:hypothetical protein
MALYAAHLATGNNIFCRSLKAVTISGYLRDVARFLSRFSPLDACYRNTTDKTFAPCIKAVTDEVACWEKIPDHREPFTIEMWKHLSSLSSTYPPDGIFAVITDWAGCGLYGGFRNTEWAQDEAMRLSTTLSSISMASPKPLGLTTSSGKQPTAPASLCILPWQMKTRSAAFRSPSKSPKEW